MNHEPSRPDLHSRDYPVREDMAWQTKVWRFERVGWCVLLLVVLLALSGLFSRGPLSSRDIHGSDGKIAVQYEMFHRSGSSNLMRISVTGAPQAPVELELAGTLLDGFSIETLYPSPVRVVSAGQGVKLWVQTDAQGHANLYLSLRGDGVGLFRSRIDSPGAESVNLNQFIFP